MTKARKAIIATSAILSIAAAWQAPIDARSEPPRSRYNLTIPLDPPIKLELPTIAGPADRPLVIIDPGHGGHDPGAIAQAQGQREKDVTLAIARAIRQALIESGRARVGLTRDDDHFIALAERYEIARAAKADLFISIHADSAGTRDASGATIYTLSETASDQEAARLAERENRADLLNGVSLSGRNKLVDSILIDLRQREAMEASVQFARILHRETEASLPYRSIYHRHASLIVLKAPDVPSVLFETGYLSNDRNARFLVSEQGRKVIAQGAARAIETFLARKAIGQ